MNRNNCGCTPYKPNTDKADYVQELRETCDCVLPCESCECVEETGACPPPPPCKPLQRMKCCVEKPKKSFWQLLFGGKKCSPGLKKKTDKKVKPVTNLKCVPLPNLNNELSEDNVECQQAASKYSSNSCHRKGCFPTPQSICGCHFYFNIENRTKRHAMTIATNDQQLSECNETPYEYNYDINEEPERDNLATSSAKANPNGNTRQNPTKNISSSPYKTNEGKKNITQRYLAHSNRNSGRRKSSVAFQPPGSQTRRISRISSQTRRSSGISYNNGERKSSLCSRKQKSCCSRPSLPIQTKTPSKVHIGLTFTKEETKYYMPNNDICLQPEQNSGFECKNSQSDDSKESSEQLITVQIHKGSVDELQNEDGKEVDGHDVLNGDKNIKSESLSREVIPLMKRRGHNNGAIRLSMREDESEENIDNTHRQHNKSRSSLTSGYRSKANLDRRVSEILEKLNEIENKISIIEKKGQDNKKIQVDFDGAKSTVSLHIKKPTNKNCDNGNNHNNYSKRGSGNTVIEIRQTQSKYDRTLFQENELQSSQSLDACDTTQSSSHKIVIKLPKIGAKTKHCVLPDKQNNQLNGNCKQTVLLSEVSDELKCSPFNVSTKCYCYECVQKRLRCW